MSLINVKNAAPNVALSSMDVKQSDSYYGNTASDPSATFYLLKKAVSGIHSVAKAVWEMYHEFCCDENLMGIIEGINDHALAEVRDVTISMLSSAVSPYFYAASKALQFLPNDDDDTCTQDVEALVTSDELDSLPCEHNTEINEAGLMLRREESTQGLDYVITQVDISRMTRTASRKLNVESIHQLPTIIYHPAETISICSSHDEEDVDDFLLRNAHIIEDYFDNVEDNIEHECQQDEPKIQLSQFSWMVVPDHPNEDKMTRMSNYIEADEIPDSVSVCKSIDSVNNMQCSMHESIDFEQCVLCQEPFQEGECLCVLPCEHLLHCSCIDKWISQEMSGCPMCTIDV